MLKGRPPPWPSGRRIFQTRAANKGRLGMDDDGNIWHKDKLARFQEEIDKGYWRVKDAIWNLFEYSEKYSEKEITTLCAFLYGLEDDERNTFIKRSYLPGAKIQPEEQTIKEYLRIEYLFNTWFEGNIKTEVINPYDFISWAMERESIEVPQIMIDWKLNQDNGGNPYPLPAKPKITMYGRQEKSYKVLLAALLNELDLYPPITADDKTRSAKTADLINRNLNELGSKLDPKTIRKYLASLKDALEKRPAD